MGAEAHIGDHVDCAKSNSWIMQSGYLNRSVFQAHCIAFGYLNSTRLRPPHSTRFRSLPSQRCKEGPRRPFVARLGNSFIGRRSHKSETGYHAGQRPR